MYVSGAGRDRQCDDTMLAKALTLRGHVGRLATMKSSDRSMAARTQARDRYEEPQSLSSRAQYTQLPNVAATLPSDEDDFRCRLPRRFSGGGPACCPKEPESLLLPSRCLLPSREPLCSERDADPLPASFRPPVGPPESALAVAGRGASVVPFISGRVSLWSGGLRTLS